ncbi:MAG: hypothetical protein E7260_08300 [Lachnospiraceae bacterium]|nr:hypothetical protein [Lachnospiraceae bacterium]
MKFNTSGAGVGVGDMVGVGVTVGVGDRVGVGDTVGVGDRVGVGVTVGVGDRVGVGDNVGVGDGERVASGVCVVSKGSEGSGIICVGIGGPNTSVFCSLNTSAYRLEKEPGIIKTKKETQVTANPSSVRCSLFISDKSSGFQVDNYFLGQTFYGLKIL